MKRRTTGPLAMMGCLGLMGVVFFGGMVWWMSDKPIIRLRPELEKQYGVNGFRCSLHIQEGRLDIELPDKLVLDRLSKRRLGADAMGRYLRLTKGQTQVSMVQVLPPPSEFVTRDQAERLFQFETYAMEVSRVATAAGGPPVGTPLCAPAMSGVAVALEVTCDDATAKRVAAAVLKVADVSFVQVRRNGKVLQESGADANIYGSGVAPVGSPSR